MSSLGINEHMLNREQFRRAAKKRSWMGILPLAPAFLLVLLTFIVPIAWLFGLSFIGDDGYFTLENYTRLIQPIYVLAFVQTFKISLIVTLVCVLVGYPYAWVMLRGPRFLSSLCMALLMISLWTSLLVRTYAWLVLLQRRGVINNLLIESGILDSPMALIYNLTGTSIGMVHIMLPFMVLPLFAAMKNINPLYMQAAATFGASPSRAFRDIFLPLSLPGLGAGATLVFVLCLGFYVTPSLLGGGRVQVLSMRIESDVAMYSNWGAASALGVVLLLVTLLLLLAAKKLSTVKWRGK